MSDSRSIFCQRAPSPSGVLSMQSSGAVPVPQAVPIPEAVQQRYVADGLWDDVALRDGIEAWAARTPDRIALIDNVGACSYAELEARVTAAVGALRGRGIG